MFKKQLLMILFIFWAQESSCYMTELFDIVQKVWEFAQYLNELEPVKVAKKALRDYIKEDNEFKGIVVELKVINHKLYNLKAHSVDKLNYITFLIEQLPTEISMELKKDELAKFVAITHKLWNDLISHVEHGASDQMFNDLANEIKDNLRLQLVEFRNALTPSSGSVNSPHDGIFMLIVENAQALTKKTSREWYCTLYDIASSANSLAICFRMDNFKSGGALMQHYTLQSLHLLLKKID